MKLLNIKGIMPTMKINRKIVQTGLLVVITGLAFAMIAYVNQSACAIAFHQPEQPKKKKK